MQDETWKDAQKTGPDKAHKELVEAYDAAHGHYECGHGINRITTPKPAASPKKPFGLSGGK